MTVEDYITQATEALDNFDFVRAKDFYDKIVTLAPHDTDVLATYSHILLELGMVEAAKKVLIQTVSLPPSSENSSAHFYENFLNLGQLTVGKESLGYFLKGAENIEQQLQSTSGAVVEEERKRILRKNLSSVYCSCAELYMSDLCFEEGAEKECMDYIQKAFSAALTPEVYQLQANLFICQNKQEEAIISIKKSLDMWVNLPATAQDSTADSIIPSYAQRVACSKLLIELGLYEECFELLSRLQKENDEDIEIWYLFGWGYYLVKDFTAAKECLQMGQTLYYKLGYNDLELIQHLEELLAEMNEMMIEEDVEGGAENGDGADEIDEDAEIEID